MTGVSTE